MARTISISDYVTVSDAPFELSSGHVRRFKFDLPGDFSKQATTVLMFGITPDDDVKYLVIVNDVAADPNNTPPETIVDSQELHGATFRTLHEVVPGEKFLGGQGFENLLDVRVITGRARFHDIVLFHQRNVTVLD